MFGIIRKRWLIATLALVSFGCRAAQPTVATTPLTPPVATGGELVPSVAGGALGNPGATAPLVAQQAPTADCPPANAKPTRSWRDWLPTKEQNDPSRERGEFTNGFYEPDYRGISD